MTIRYFLFKPGWLDERAGSWMLRLCNSAGKTDNDPWGLSVWLVEDSDIQLLSRQIGAELLKFPSDVPVIIKVDRSWELDDIQGIKRLNVTFSIHGIPIPFTAEEALKFESQVSLPLIPQPKESRDVLSGRQLVAK